MKGAPRHTMCSGKPISRRVDPFRFFMFTLCWCVLGICCFYAGDSFGYRREENADYAESDSRSGRGRSGWPDGGPDTDDRQYCDETASWYSCSTPTCHFVNPCPSNKKLMNCGCSLPTGKEVKTVSDPYAMDELMRNGNPCSFVNMDLPLTEWERCTDYLAHPLVQPRSNCTAPVVPYIFTAVGKDSGLPRNVAMIAAGNPEFSVHYYSDMEALNFIAASCGAEVAEAYKCLLASAFRADLFRFCKLYVDGGVYVDSDIVLLGSINETVSMCAGVTLGLDYPYANRMSTPSAGVRPGKQMKIISSRQRHPMMKCMVDKIVDNVRNRFYPLNSLMISGPQLLHLCYERHKEDDDVDLTYRDSRQARYPYAGMMGRQKLLAVETPDYYHPALVSKTDAKTKHYSTQFEEGHIYKESCAIPCVKGECLKHAPWSPKMFIRERERLLPGTQIISGGHKMCRADPVTNNLIPFLWQSSTEKQSGLSNTDARAHFQPDFNLVVYSLKGEVLWATNTYRISGGAFIELRPSGELVIGEVAGVGVETKENIFWRSNGKKSTAETVLVLLSSGTLAICEKKMTM